MKKILASLAVLIALASFTTGNVNPAANTPLSGKHSFKKYHVTGSVTLSGGCHVSYDLWVDVSIIPPRYNGISGTITMSGNCSGTQTINARASVDQTKDSYVTSGLVIDERVFDEREQAELAAAIQAQLNTESDAIFGSR
ncbi:MAG: hypothetical protein JWQ27_268 [Ferruginibacter sp.]|nr:hypothetical protein [Ferruginibacter sp.]